MSWLGRGAATNELEMRWHLGSGYRGISEHLAHRTAGSTPERVLSHALAEDN